MRRDRKRGPCLVERSDVIHCMAGQGEMRLKRMAKCPVVLHQQDTHAAPALIAA
jgi:hypothetical protein